MFSLYIYRKVVIQMATKKGFPNKSTCNRPGASVDRDTPTPKTIKGGDLRTKGSK